MKTGLPWQVNGVRPQARETAREAARRAGMSIGEWLDSIILDSAQPDEVDGRRPAQRNDTRDDKDFASREDADRARRSSYAGDRQYDDRQDDGRQYDSGPYDDRNDARAGEYRGQPIGDDDRHWDRPVAHGSYAVENPHDEALQGDRPPFGRKLPPPPAAAPSTHNLAAELEQRLPPARGEERPAAHEGFAELNQRLDDLSRQLSQVASLSAAHAARPDPRNEPPPLHLVEVISKLDHRLDQLIAEGRSGKTDIEQRVNAVGRAVADLDREGARPVAVPEPATPLDQALLEIADRQRTLDGCAPLASAPASTRATTASEALPRACTQELSALEQQLRQINAHVGNLQPCGVDRAIDTLRDDLAQIGFMLQEAMPRKSVEVIEREMRELADRIDHSRNAGADGAALAGMEHGLAEVRDALRGLAPAKNLSGVDRDLQQLSQRIDDLAHDSADPEALRQLESAIIGLRGIVSHAASNDALASLSDEVHALAGKVDRVVNSGSDGVLHALEERIGALADALAARNDVGQRVPYELEAVIKGLVDKIERVQLTRGDHAALGHLEDRIAKLVEKLDASDARLNHLETIERGLAELLIHLEHNRVPNLARAGFPPAEVNDLTRDVADLRQTGKKTQESLELVHGTLGHVVDRLAMIETDVRSKAVQPAESSYAVETISAAPADCDPAKPAAPKKTAERPAEKPGLPPSPPFAQGPQPLEFALREPSKPEPAPNVGRRPIDSSLPPDHPLEPGSSGSRRSHPESPADRIAASESALAGIRPSVNPEPGGTSNFIAAARRAAQAAGPDRPVKSGASGPREIASAAGKLASRVGKLRALIAGTSAIMIVLGGLQIARTFLSAPHGADADLQEGQSQSVVAAPERPAPAAIPIPAAVNGAVPPLSEPVSPSLVSPRPASSEPATGRQSTAFPDGAGSQFAGSDIMIPLEIERQASGATNLQPARSVPAAPEREITGSISSTAASAATKPTAAPASAASTPSTPAQPSGAALAPASDRLPAAFGSSLRAAAAKGDAAAQFEIASRYAEGRGVAQNLTEAVEWYERAAKHGLVPAQFRLGGLYEKGLGVKKNPETARRYYLAAGEAGNAKALHNLAVLYAEGIDGKPDYQTAAKWFRKAADYGIADSQYNLAVLYARGIGVEQNLAEAYKWFALAARDGDTDSAKKRDDLEARLDRSSLTAAAQAVQSWVPQRQPDAAVEVTPPPGGWDQAATTSSSSPIVPAKRKQPAVGPPKLDLATPQVVQ